MMCGLDFVWSGVCCLDGHCSRQQLVTKKYNERIAWLVLLRLRLYFQPLVQQLSVSRRSPSFYVYVIDIQMECCWFKVILIFQQINKGEGGGLRMLTLARGNETKLITATKLDDRRFWLLLSRGYWKKFQPRVTIIEQSTYVQMRRADLFFTTLFCVVRCVL